MQPSPLQMKPRPLLPRFCISYTIQIPPKIRQNHNRDVKGHASTFLLPEEEIDDYIFDELVAHDEEFSYDVSQEEKLIFW